MALFVTTSFAVAEPFQEVTLGVPVASIVDAEAWYLNLLGSDVEVLKPFPGVVKVPNIVSFSEFTDPDGSALEVYDLP